MKDRRKEIAETDAEPAGAGDPAPRSPGVVLAARTASDGGYYVFAEEGDEGGAWKALDMEGPLQAGHFVDHLKDYPWLMDDDLELFLVFGPTGASLRGSPKESFLGECNWDGARLSLFRLEDSEMLETVRQTFDKLEEAQGPAGPAEVGDARPASGFMLGGSDTVLTIDGTPVLWRTEEGALAWLRKYGPAGSLVDRAIKKLRPHKEESFVHAYFAACILERRAAQAEEVAQGAAPAEGVVLVSWEHSGSRFELVAAGKKVWADNFSGPASVN